jgi:hypothetical protein
MAERREAPPVNESEAQRVNRALAEAAQEAEERKADELPIDGGAVVDGQPVGGRFIVDGETVGPDGKPIGKKPAGDRA